VPRPLTPNELHRQSTRPCTTAEASHELRLCVLAVLHMRMLQPFRFCVCMAVIPSVHQHRVRAHAPQPQKAWRASCARAGRDGWRVHLEHQRLDLSEEGADGVLVRSQHINACPPVLESWWVHVLRPWWVTSERPTSSVQGLGAPSLKFTLVAW